MATKSYIEVIPTTQLLRAMRRNRFGWERALSELLDNSLDAGAMKIDISHKPHHLTIVDNGHGTRDLHAMLTLGEHVESDTTQLGTYGVGLKDAAMYFFGETRIASCHGRRIHYGIANWKQIEESGAWAIPRPASVPTTRKALKDFGLSLGPGTIVEFQGHDRPLPKNIDDVLATLSYRFSPAIEQGVRIRFVWHQKERDAQYTLKRYQHPALSLALNDNLAIDGKSAKLVAGVVEEGEPNIYHGFNVVYRHRVILNTVEPCRRHGSANFFGWVELGDEWVLSRNKEDIEEDREALFNALYGRCKALLEKARQRRDKLTVEASIEEQQRRLRSAIVNLTRDEVRDGTTRSDRGDEPDPPLDPRKKRKRKKRRPRKTRPGNKYPDTTTPVIDVLIQTIPGERKAVTASFSDGAFHVNLGGQHPYVIEAQSRVPSRLGEIALAGIAHFVARSPANHPCRKILPDADHEGGSDMGFGAIYSGLLVNLVKVDAA